MIKTSGVQVKRMAIFGVIVAAFIIAIAIMPQKANAAEVTVTSFAELNTAITNAGNGDVIKVANDINLVNNQYLSLNNKTITITSADANNPVTIKRTATAVNVPMVFLKGTSNLTMNGIVIDGGAVWDKTGLGAVNSGVVANLSVILAQPGTTVNLGKGTILQNNEVNNANGGAGKVVGGGITAQGATVNIDGAIVQKNCANGTANDGGALTASAFAHGGGIVLLGTNDTNATTLTMTSGAISDNWVKQGSLQNGYGGNVEAWRFGTGPVNVNISGGEISRGYAGQGGGLYVNGADFKMSGGTVADNTSGTSGGGILAKKYNDTYVGSFEMTGGTVSGNKAAGPGGIDGGFAGGLYLQQLGSSIIKDATFTNNNATQGGGAITINGGDATISGDTKITGNTTDGLAGGIYLSVDPAINTGGDLTIGGTTTISGNTAKAEAPIGNGIYDVGDSLTITTDETKITDDILLSNRKSQFVTITTPIQNSSFDLSTRATDSENGRIVVKPGGTLTDASLYSQAFTHNRKGVIPDGNNLVLGLLKINYDTNKPSGATAEPSPSSIPSKNIDIDQVIPLPDNPTLKGYTFKGWAYDAAGKNPFNKTDKLTKAENITLYAQWAKNGNNNGDGTNDGTNGKNDGKNGPKTGDNSNMILYIVMLAIAFSSSGVAYYTKRKNNNR